MERLTFYNESGEPCFKARVWSSVHGCIVDSTVSGTEVAKKLAAYEDAAPLETVQRWAEAEREGRILPEGFSCIGSSGGNMLYVWHPAEVKVVSEKRTMFVPSGEGE